MVKYLLTTFHTHDEEIETVHLPVVLNAILGQLVVSYSWVFKEECLIDLQTSTCCN